MLWAYADELHAARCCFGLGMRDTRERVRIGRALRQLPRIEAAFVGGELSYSRVREVTRVAEPETESHWLELARSLDMRSLERRDQCRCRVPGCGRRRYVDVHHVEPRARGGVHSRSNCFVICRTHHRPLHDGKLHVAGDAEGELSFRHASGEPFVDLVPPTPLPLASERQVEIEAELDVASQGGSSPDGAATGSGASLEPAGRVLELIGRRGAWSLDALVEGSGLSVNAVAGALTLLELAGRVRCRDFVYDPV